MIRIDGLRCTGCGACVEACPTGALYLVDGKAAVDEALCRACEACLNACPREAISLVSREAPAREPAHLPAVRPAPEVIRVTTTPTALRSGTPAPLTLRARVLPALGAALAWTGREIVPRLADILIDRLDRPAPPAAGPGSTVARAGGSGRQRAAGGGGRRWRQRRGGRTG